MSAPPTTRLPAPAPAADGQPTVSRWLPVLAQALWPGLGTLLRRRIGTGLVLIVLWPALIITSNMRLVDEAGGGAARVALWLGLLALVWLNTVYRAVREARARSPEAQLAQRLAGQGRNPLTWLASLNLLLLAGLLFLLDRMALDSEVDLRELINADNIGRVRRMAGGLFRPDFSVTEEVIRKYAWVTLEMAVMGTIGGSLLSIPISFLGARNLVGRRRATAPIYYVTRFLLSVFRSIPTLIWGLIALSVFKLGHFPGVVALSIFSFGLTAKLYSEAIEGIDWGPVEAVTAAGANPLHTLIFGVVPQVIPSYIAHFLYCLEVNVHSSVVLGLIGAGGLGFIVNEYIAVFQWEKASTVLLITIVLTLGIDYGSAYVRGRVI